MWSELFSWIERRRYGKRIGSSPVPDDPIFIIGHWRTGTTLLHQLLDLDPELAAPTLFQVAEPGCFICSYRYYMPVFSAMLPQKRPMDNVRIGINEPQEDEYAIYRITGFSPIERLVFPLKKDYFVLDETSYLPADEKERKEWMESLRSYFQKLHYVHGKRIISKNPFNSMRIRELAAMFPKARFVHITRHPFEVVPSSMNMWKIVTGQNRLNRNGKEPGVGAVAEGIRMVLSVIGKDKNLLPSGYFHEMRFEDLQTKPVEELKKMYNRFDMKFEDSLQSDILTYLEGLKNYEKNVFHLTEDEKSIIRKSLGDHMEIFNYH
jgi:hypothetical protein